MPIYPPRTAPVKKQEELTKREIDLIHAIKKNVASDKLIKFVDKYRQAQISLIKAKIHQFKENEFRKKPNAIQFKKLQEQIAEWTDKANDDIISKVKESQ